MNINVKTIFAKIGEILKSYSEQADALGNTFNTNKAFYESTYRNADGYIEADKAKISDALNTLIAGTRSELALCRQMLQQNLQEWSSEVPQEDFVRDMKTYLDFNLKRTEDELNADLKRCSGNLTSMRILQKIAKASGYDLSFDGPESFTADLRQLDSISASLDVSLPSSCKDFLPAMRQTSTGVWYSLDSVGAIMAQTVLNSYLRDLDSISDKWTAEIQPTIKACLQSLESAKNEKSVNIDDLSFQKTPADAELTVENPFEESLIIAGMSDAEAQRGQAHYFH